MNPTIDRELLLDILSTGIDWSCANGYWSQIESYHYERWCPDTGEGILDSCLPVEDDFVFYTIHALRPDESGYEREGTDITPALLRLGFTNGLAAPVDRGGWMFRNLVQIGRDDWPGNIDADIADAIVQFGVYGRLEWG